MPARQLVPGAREAGRQDASCQGGGATSGRVHQLDRRAVSRPRRHATRGARSGRRPRRRGSGSDAPRPCHALERAAGSSASSRRAIAGRRAFIPATKEPIMTHDATSATSLKDSIAAFTANMAKKAPAEVIATLGAEIRKLAESGIAAGALQVGAKAPGFALPDARGKLVTLSGVLARGPAIVTFYRGGWCPFCDLQLRSYQGVLAQIHDLGAELLAISPQTPDYALSDVEKKQLTFPVLTDKGNAVAREFKLVFALSDELKKLQTHFGSVLPKFNGDESWELPMPGTFVLDRHGTVRFASVDPNWMVRVEPATILEALRGARAS